MFWGRNCSLLKGLMKPHLLCDQPFADYGLESEHQLLKIHCSKAFDINCFTGYLLWFFLWLSFVLSGHCNGMFALISWLMALWIWNLPCGSFFSLTRCLIPEGPIILILLHLAGGMVGQSLGQGRCQGADQGKL